MSSSSQICATAEVDALPSAVPEDGSLEATDPEKVNWKLKGNVVPGTPAGTVTVMTSNMRASPRASIVTSSPWPTAASAGVLNKRPPSDRAYARRTPVGKFATAEAAEAPSRHGKVEHVKEQASTGQNPRFDPADANMAPASRVSVTNAGAKRTPSSVSTATPEVGPNWAAAGRCETSSSSVVRTRTSRRDDLLRFSMAPP